MALGRFRALREQLKDGRKRVLLWTTFAALIFGLIQFGEPLELTLKLVRNRLRDQPPSSEILVVAIDDETVRRHDAPRWSQRDHARLLDAIAGAGARRVFHLVDLPLARDAADAAALESSMRRHRGRIHLAARFAAAQVSHGRRPLFADTRLQRPERQVNTNYYSHYTGIAWQLPFAHEMGGHVVPAFGATLAGVNEPPGGAYFIDYSIDVSAIAQLSAGDALAGRGLGAVAGRDVVIANTAAAIAKEILVPGQGLMPSVYVHLAGAETLRKGRPVELGWLPPLAITFVLAAFLTSRTRFRRRRLAVSAAFLLLVFGPLPLEQNAMLVDVVPAIFLLSVMSLFMGSGRLWSTYRRRANVNDISGMPNLAALRQQADVADHLLVVARVRNYAEVCTALPAEQESALAHEISKRLALGACGATLFHGDDGTFAWFAPRHGDDRIREHLEALHAVFRSPVVVAGGQFDLIVTFGVEASHGRSVANRLGGALVAVDHAVTSGKIWMEADPADIEDASWRLSILSQLDAAAETGDLWVAYQPKIDLATRTVTGAEALVRWTHPEKGPISPLEFIPLAEQSGRIGELTVFVLERAVRAAATINRSGIEFGVSVNLSATLLNEPGLEVTVAEILERHRLHPSRLTLEVTETAALCSPAGEMDPLHRLREMGVQISIDDYGTGLSTLEYLRRIPASEIKVDRSFVQSIHKSHSDKLMVHSTIQLAHSLGHKVVAEGVEDVPTLEALAMMGCDEAQGFLMGKPMPIDALVEQLTNERRACAA